MCRVKISLVMALCSIFSVEFPRALQGEEKAGTESVSLKDAPVNTWVKILQTPTGWREQPIFVYAWNIKRFVMAAGYQAYGGMVQRHYDTEEFDLATLKWINAYPLPLAAGRPESGPVGEEYSRQCMMLGYNGFQMFYKDGDFLRLAAGGQWTENRAGYEFCYVARNGLIYTYLHDKTLCYDPVKRVWTDLGSNTRTSCKIWGSMCYDPVNNEIFHAGGDGGYLEIGTWIFDLEKNEWRKLEFGSPDAKRLFGQAREVLWQVKALLGAIANRFTVAETVEEAKVDLAKKAHELEDSLTGFATQIKTARLAGGERKAAEVALRRLEGVLASLQALKAKLSRPITAAVVSEARAVRVQFEQVVDALAVEPPGRARSQIACDPIQNKILLFGGDQLDRTLSDTWVYDCRTRTWEQRFPNPSPLPRAGHILAGLPKAKKFVLAGGYSKGPLAQEIWTYDVLGDRWQLLVYVPLKPSGSGREMRSSGCPATNRRTTQVGAVNEDDILVCVTPEQPSLVTWACKVEPNRPIEIPESQVGAPGLYDFNRIAPETWEAVANPDPEKAQKLFGEMPVNQWTALPFAKYAPGARHRWGTTAYDRDRHQFLFWGGGHATSQENDVAHFSVRGLCWTIGYHPDDPIEKVYASQPTPISFHNRPHVPVHAYKAYCYDYSAKKMLFFDRAYDPAVREWEIRAYPGLQHSGVMHSHVEPTPLGAVCYSAKGLFRFNPQAGAWQKLPWEGPNPGKIWCDGDSVLYDSKRDCLWLAIRKDIYRYELSTGKAEKIAFKKPKVLGEFLFYGEEVYLSDADLVLIMNLFTRPDGTLSNVAWDPNDYSFYWVDLKFFDGEKEIRFQKNPFSWHDALAYDPELKLVFLNNSSSQKVWALKFDKRTARLERIQEEEQEK